MTRFAKTAVLLMATVISANGHRLGRASSGAYSGVSNGQFFGGSYEQPNNGPPIINTFGNPGAFAGPGFAFAPGAFAGAGGAYAGSGAYAGPAGAFVGPGVYAPQFPFGPSNPPFQNPFEFNKFFNYYFQTLNNNLASAYAGGSSSDSSSGSSEDSSSNDEAFAKSFENQRAAFEAAQKAFQTTANNQFGAGQEFQYYSPGFNGAAASASIGPHGGHQSAGVYPANPSNPNVHVRFGGNEGRPGVFGVATSSFSSSSDVDGKKSSHKQSTTTINDNGKIKTYTVKS